MDLRQMEAHATILDQRSTLDDIRRLADLERGRWKPMQRDLIDSGEPLNADGIYYIDSLPPFESAAMTSVTLLTTAQVLWPVATWTSTPGGKYWYPGKELRLRIFGTITTPASAGAITVSINYGTANATGALATSASTAVTASATTQSFTVDSYVQCRGVGASGSGGSLFAWGRFTTGTGLVASPSSLMIPASAPAAVNADTTVASGINIQILEAATSGGTVVVHDLIFQSLN